MEPLRCRLLASRGFTLIELLVVAGIIIILSGVIFSSQSSFNNSVVLSSTAYDVALTLDDAQTYGLGTRATGGLANAGYGLDFTKASPTSYTFFADSNPAAGNAGTCHPLPANGAGAPNAYPGNCYFDSGDTVVSTYTLGNTITVSNFCAYNGSWSCSASGNQALKQLDIIFLRPNAMAFISDNGVYVSSPAITEACIAVSASQGSSRFVTVSANGQITASATSCP